MLVKILKRFRTLSAKDQAAVQIPAALHYFLTQKTNLLEEQNALQTYLELDDSDLLQAIKVWQNHPDFLISNFSQRLKQRNLLKIKLDFSPIKEGQFEAKKEALLAEGMSASKSEALIFQGSVSNQMYMPKESEFILIKDGKETVSLAHFLKYLDMDHFSSPQVKHYLCYPKLNL